MVTIQRYSINHRVHPPTPNDFKRMKKKKTNTSRLFDLVSSTLIAKLLFIMEVYKKVDVRESTLKTLSWVWTYIQCPKSSFFIRDLNCFTSRTIAAQPFSIKSVVYCIYLSIEWSNICGFNVVIE